MPWTTDRLDFLISEVRELLLKEFPDIFTASIFICSQIEMVINIKKQIKRDEFKGEIQDYLAKFIIGKYFAEENVIWLVEGKGDNVPTLLHELLHSIQKCAPHRENIIEYLMYKLMDRSDIIDHRLLIEWKEIEKTHGFEVIKEKLLSKSDCEDF